MKKLKLFRTLLVAVMMLGGVSFAWGQAAFNHTYTRGTAIGEVTTESATYFLYNIGAGKFLTDGMYWGTHASVDNAGRLIKFTSATNGYSLYTQSYSVNNGEVAKAGYMTLNGYLDTSINDADWIFTPVSVDGYENVYTIKNSDTQYLYFSSSDCYVNVGESTGDNKSYWLIIPITTRQAANDYTYLLQNTDFNRDTDKKRIVWSESGGTFNSAGGNNDNRCAEIYNGTFTFNQTVAQTVPNGKYTLHCQGFYRAGLPDGNNSIDQNAQLYINTTTSPLTNAATGGSNTETGGYTTACDGKYIPNLMTEASTVFSAGGYTDNAVTAIVTDGSISVGLKSETTIAGDWTIFDNFVLDYLGTTLINDAEEFTSGSDMTAGTWYKYTATSTWTCDLSATTLSDIIYTTDGTQLTASATGSTLPSTLSLTEGDVIYIKSASTQSLTISYSSITNVDIDFSNAISDGTVAGTKGSMTLSNLEGDYKFELGYDDSNTDVLRVGNGTGTVTIDPSEYAGSSDVVIVSFDMYYGNLSKKNAGFYVNDKDGTTIGKFSVSKYSGTKETDNFGIDLGWFNAIGKSGTNNNAICVESNRTHFTLYFNYATGKMHAVVENDGKFNVTAPVDMLSTKPVGSFIVQSDYSSNAERRCWFDNLLIKTAASTDVTYNYLNGSSESFKAAEVVKAAVGTTSTHLVANALKEDMIVGAYRHIYSSTTGDETVKQDGTTNINLNHSSIANVTSFPSTADFASVKDPFDNGTIVDATNIGKVLLVNNTTATTYFDSDTSTDGYQAYAPAELETVTIEFDAFNGYLNKSYNSIVSVLNSEGKVLAGYTYDVNNTNVTDVKLGNGTVDGFESFTGISYSASHNANGYKDGTYPFVTTSGNNPHVTITVSGSGKVTFKFDCSTKLGANNPKYFEKDLSDFRMDIAAIQITDNNSNNPERSSCYDNFSITTETATAPTISVSSSSTTVKKDEAISLTATTDGNPAPTIQWYSNTTNSTEGGVEIGGATNATYSPSTSSVGTTYYYAVATNVVSSVTSEVIPVIVAEYQTEFSVAGKTTSKTVEYNTVNEELTSTNVTINGGSMYISNYKNNTETVVTSGGKFQLNATLCFFKVVLDNALQAGDIISASVGNSTGRGISIYADYSTTDRPSTTNHIDLATTSNAFETKSYTITNDDTYLIGQKTIYIYRLTNNGTYFDNLTISRPNTVSGKIGSTGWTTFSSNYKLDLSTINGGSASAYYASSSDESNVTLTSTTDKVNAGEGLMIKGTAGETFTIEKTSDAATFSGTNLLVGCKDGQTLTANAYYYVLVNNGGTAEFQSLEDYGATIPAGKAYLDAGRSSAKSLKIVFSDETLGISDALRSHDNAETSDKLIYNLSGQKLAAPQKGINIINGRKVVVK